MCDWPVYAARPCSKDTAYQVGPLGVCTQHFDILLTGIMGVARSSADVAARMRFALRQAEIGHSAAEQEAREARYAAEGRPPCIYFAQRGEFVKIGTTVDIASRLRTLSAGAGMVDGMTAGPVTLLATIPGGLKEERRLHRRFRRLRVDPRREWFRFEGALLEYVKSLLAV